MAQIKMAGNLVLDVANVLVEVSPVMKNGMKELVTETKSTSRWQSRKINRCLKTCGGHLFYRMHPEALDFLKRFWFRRTYNSKEKYVDVSSMFDEDQPANLAVEDAWQKEGSGEHHYMGNYFTSGDGWVMVGALPPSSEIMPTVLANRFSKFETHVMGLPARKIAEITKAMLADHYIQFEMRDRKGDYNSLAALIPFIVDKLKKPPFPTPEIEALCKDDS